jgi:pyruvate formate lyase activating enzyme
MTTRRAFIATTSQLSPALGLGFGAWAQASRLDAETLDAILRTAPKARHWLSVAQGGTNCRACHSGDIAGKTHAHANGLVQCQLCAQRCAIQVSQRGRCRVRMNVGGELRSLSYGRPAAVNVDPIEKKPFYHFLPGSIAFSFGTPGCPLHCKFCQNWELSQSLPEDHDTQFTTPDQVVGAVVARKAPVIAFTYNEPTVFFEYLMDVAKSAAQQRVRSVMVSCGFMNEAPLAELCSTVAAIKIDLKGFSEDFYRNVCSAELRPVLNTIRAIARRKVHLEIVNLVVPTLNDSDELLKALASWVMNEVGPDVPIHFTRFHPDYQLLNLAPTPIATLERARNIALTQGIHHAYVGNVPGHPGNHTYCPKCKEIIIQRSGFFVTDNRLKNGRCPKCQQPIPGVWR